MDFFQLFDWEPHFQSRPKTIEIKFSAFLSTKYIKITKWIILVIISYIYIVILLFVDVLFHYYKLFNNPTLVETIRNPLRLFLNKVFDRTYPFTHFVR